MRRKINNYKPIISRTTRSAILTAHRGILSKNSAMKTGSCPESGRRGGLTPGLSHHRSCDSASGGSVVQRCIYSLRYLSMDTLVIGCKFPTIRTLYGLSPIRLRPCWANPKNGRSSLNVLHVKSILFINTSQKFSIYMSEKL